MLNKAFKIFLALLKNPALLLKVLQPSDSEALNRVQQKYNIQGALPCISFFDLIKPEKNNTVSTYTALSGGSLLTDYFLLGLLAETYQCQYYFEIGTWRGESAVNVAPFVEQVFSLNLDTENLINRGSPPQYIEQIGMLCKAHKNITLLKGDSARFDFSPYYNQCDLIFIDGDHNYTSIIQDTKNALKLRKNKQSIIVWHDYAYSPNQIRHEVLLAILDAVPKEMHSALFHISNTQCAVLMTHPVSSFPFDPLAPPQYAFEVSLFPKKIDG